MSAKSEPLLSWVMLLKLMKTNISHRVLAIDHMAICFDHWKCLVIGIRLQLECNTSSSVPRHCKFIRNVTWVSSYPTANYIWRISGKFIFVTLVNASATSQIYMILNKFILNECISFAESVGIQISNVCKEKCAMYKNIFVECLDY